MKRIDVVCVGLALSDQLLLRAFLQLIAPINGHVFKLCDRNDAAVVIFNPADNHAAMLLKNPQRGIAYIQYGKSEFSFDRVWRLSMPARLPALSEIMAGIVKQRREWVFSGAIAPEAEASPNLVALPVPAHRRLEHVLGALENIVQSRIPHALSGITGVEIVVFPQENKVYIKCDSGVSSSWQKALADTQRPIAALSRIGARPLSDVEPISIAHLRWELARHLSMGMLLPGLVSRQLFCLSKWPDFGTMTAGSAYDLRIVALITTRPTSIAGMLQTVPYTREGVIALLNGCALVGCLRDAPADLLHSVEAQKPSPAIAALSPIKPSLSSPTLSSQTPPNQTLSSQTPTNQALPNQKPQRGFASVLSKLRAALSFVPRSIQ